MLLYGAGLGVGIYLSPLDSAVTVSGGGGGRVFY